MRDSALARAFASPVVMTLELKSQRRASTTPQPTAIPVRVTHEDQAAVVLITEALTSAAQDWELLKKKALSDGLNEMGVGADSVVVVSQQTLPTLSNGSIDVNRVLEQFPRRRGYVREELEAWVVNRLCEVLYFAPSELDAGQNWARYGVDSAVALEIVADLEDWLELRLPQTVAECRTPRELVSFASTRLLETGNRLDWWRSPWVTVEGL